MALKFQKERSVQQLLGIQRFTNYGLLTNRGELLFFSVAPTNISVLSPISIRERILRLEHLLSAVPDIQILCTDRSESFDSNRAYLQNRAEAEPNPQVKALLQKDRDMLTQMQSELSNARQFLFVYVCKGPYTFTDMNQVFKSIAENGFEAKWLSKADIKRLLGIYFGTSMDGDLLPDVDGAQFIKEETNGSVT